MLMFTLTQTVGSSTFSNLNCTVTWFSRHVNCLSYSCKGLYCAHTEFFCWLPTTWKRNERTIVCFGSAYQLSILSWITGLNLGNKRERNILSIDGIWIILCHRNKRVLTYNEICCKENGTWRNMQKQYYCRHW